MTHRNVQSEEWAANKAFEQIVYQLEAARLKQGRARVLGITACRSGAGATFVLGNLARVLASKSRRGVLMADCADLVLASHLEPGDLLEQCCFTEDAGLRLLTGSDRGHRSSRVETSQDGGLAAAMSVLASRFDYVLLDCGAANVSGRMWQVASVVDDVFLVVAAGETKREQVTYAQRIIAQSGAPLSGCILNKRTYPLPGPLHRFLN
jgi:Mrp family chromosome partitioning ATPase